MSWSIIYAEETRDAPYVFEIDDKYVKIHNQRNEWDSVLIPIDYWGRVAARVSAIVHQVLEERT